ncbi:MAG: cation-transporting P-type ATPase, partial [Bradymonadaceae bacterium]
MSSEHPEQNQDDSTSQRPWHTYDTSEVFEEVGVDPERGLSQEEARRRLEEFGPNQVEAARETPWYKVLIKQFLDPLIYLLLLAALVALVFGKLVDTLVILAVLVINATIGFIQELRARKAIRSLSSMAAPRAVVIRDSRRQEIPSVE